MALHSQGPRLLTYPVTISGLGMSDMPNTNGTIHSVGRTVWEKTALGGSIGIKFERNNGKCKCSGKCIYIVPRNRIGLKSNFIDIIKDIMQSIIRQMPATFCGFG